MPIMALEVVRDGVTMCIGCRRGGLVGDSL